MRPGHRPAGTAGAGAGRHRAGTHLRGQGAGRAAPGKYRQRREGGASVFGAGARSKEEDHAQAEPAGGGMRLPDAAARPAGLERNGGRRRVRLAVHPRVAVRPQRRPGAGKLRQRGDRALHRQCRRRVRGAGGTQRAGRAHPGRQGKFQPHPAGRHVPLHRIGADGAAGAAHLPAHLSGHLAERKGGADGDLRSGCPVRRPHLAPAIERGAQHL